MQKEAEVIQECVHWTILVSRARLRAMPNSLPTSHAMTGSMYAVFLSRHLLNVCHSVITVLPISLVAVVRQ